MSRTASILLCALSLMASSACNTEPAPTPETTTTQSQTTGGVGAKEASADVKKVALRDTATPDKARWKSVGRLVDHAVYMGLYSAMGEVAAVHDPSGASHAGAPVKPKADIDRPRGEVLSLFHTSNVRGEREDCGCKKRPRGGLARKQTILQESLSAKSESRPDLHLVLDGGDLFFKNVRVGALGGPSAEVAKIEAEAVRDAFNIIGCDGYVVGEYDLAMGLDVVKSLQKDAKFPFLSANLLDAKTNKPVFSPFEIVKQGKYVIAVVGITDDKPALPDYYSSKGLKAETAENALERIAGGVAAAKPDFVVLLSNAGITRTQNIIAGVKDKLPMHAAVVSNTGRQTFTPVWTSGVPMFESGTRGMTMGRADFHIVDGAVAFRPMESEGARQARDYMNAYRSLNSARRAMEKLKPGTKPDRIKKLERNLKRTVDRLKRLESRLPDSLEKPKADAPKSWLVHELINVDKKINEDKRVRAALDKHVKRAEALVPAKKKAPAKGAKKGLEGKKKLIVPEKELKGPVKLKRKPNLLRPLKKKAN